MVHIKFSVIFRVILATFIIAPVLALPSPVDKSPLPEPPPPPRPRPPPPPRPVKPVRRLIHAIRATTPSNSNLHTTTTTTPVQPLDNHPPFPAHTTSGPPPPPTFPSNVKSLEEGNSKKRHWEPETAETVQGQGPSHSPEKRRKINNVPFRAFHHDNSYSPPAMPPVLSPTPKKLPSKIDMEKLEEGASAFFTSKPTVQEGPSSSKPKRKKPPRKFNPEFETWLIADPKGREVAAQMQLKLEEQRGPVIDVASQGPGVRHVIKRGGYQGPKGPRGPRKRKTIATSLEDLGHTGTGNKQSGEGSSSAGGQPTQPSGGEKGKSSK